MAFTDAHCETKGKFEIAGKGTLFLDEIGDLSIPSQVKLLRLLQEGEYFPLGSDRPKRIKARVIVATHRDLSAQEQAGGFRRDLFFRLRTHHIHIPALRERKGDIPLLLDHFLAQAAQSLGKKKPTPPPELAQLLATYDFPGNVRELRGLVYDAVSVHRDRILSMDCFLKVASRPEARQPDAVTVMSNLFTGLQRLPTFGEAAELLVAEAMSRAGGNQTIAARLLGISQPALSKRLKLSR